MKPQIIKTWRDVRNALAKLTPAQLRQPVQIARLHPMDQFVHVLLPGFVLGTVDDLGIRYARSVVDNRRHGEHVILYVDYPPFGEDGNIGTVVTLGRRGLRTKRTLYPKMHSDAANWTGPAQKLTDKKKRKRPAIDMDMACLTGRIGRKKSSTKGVAVSKPIHFLCSDQHTG